MKKRYNIMLNPAIVKVVDKYISNKDISRSEFINKLLFYFFNINTDEIMQTDKEFDIRSRIKL